MKRSNDLATDPSRATSDEAPDPGHGDESVEALEAALETARVRLQQRLADEIEHQRAESDKLKQEVEQLRAEAAKIEEQAKETAARIVAEAKQAEAQMLDEARKTVDTVQTRLRDRVGSFLDHATREIASVQEAIDAGRSAAEPAEHSVGAAAEAADERVVTRLIVRPTVAPDVRTRFKERIERLPGVDAALFGAIEDDSFEMLLAHERTASIIEGITTMAPEQIRMTARQEGRIELELTGVGWLETSDEELAVP
jgi:hypothetical protein